MYLPKGDWYDFWSGELHHGGQAVSVPVPLDTVPLFARGGSIIPLGPTMQRTDERPLDNLTLLVYPGAPGAEGRATIYEDDGASQAYRNGRHAVTSIVSTFQEGSARVEVDATSGSYDGQPATRDLVVRIWRAVRPGRVFVHSGDGRSLNAVGETPPGGAGPSWAWEAGTWVVVHIPQVACRTPVVVEVQD